MNIHVKCVSPKYARGEFEFTALEELFHWLKTIAGLAKGAPSHWLYGLAKDGRFSGSTARWMIEITSDHHDYFLARDVAFETSLLRTRGFSEIVNPSREVVLEFAREWDKRVLAGVR